MTDIRDNMENLWYWITNHVVDLVFLTAIIGIIIIGLITLTHTPSWRTQQIDLCIRAFDYTRDQCTFIVDNHVNPLPPAHGIH